MIEVMNRSLPHVYTSNSMKPKQHNLVFQFSPSTLCRYSFLTKLPAWINWMHVEAKTQIWFSCSDSIIIYTVWFTMHISIESAVPEVKPVCCLHFPYHTLKIFCDLANHIE